MREMMILIFCFCIFGWLLNPFLWYCIWSDLFDKTEESPSWRIWRKLNKEDIKKEEIK